MIDKALVKACKYIEKITGNCPLEALDYDMNCEEKCNSTIQSWECWYNYFKEKS